MARRRPDGWWYPWIFVVGFVVVIGVNMVMLLAATSTFSGLSVEHAFEKGNAYNAEIAAAKAQEALGWKADFGIAATRIEMDDTRTVRWRLTMTDAKGGPISGLAVAVRLERPAVKGFDHEITLAPTGNGRYAAETSLPLKGQWEARVTATRPGMPPFRLRERVQIP
ncbi:MAG: FixH family protein [Rhodospirillaceae bacterium]